MKFNCKLQLTFLGSCNNQSFILSLCCHFIINKVQIAAKLKFSQFLILFYNENASLQTAVNKLDMIIWLKNGQFMFMWIQTCIKHSQVVGA